MKITFLLPVPAHNPFGGAKVVYEYANGLTARGHEVTVVHTLAPTTTKQGFLYSMVTYIARGIGLRGGVGPRRWMNVHPGVKIRWAPSLHQRWIPSGDIVIATSWNTAEFAEKYPESCGQKYYFVQDYEFYMSASPDIKARMAATYRGPFKNLVISPACETMIKECGGQVHSMVPNGLDHEQFRLKVPIDSKERKYIGFPVRPEPFKRTADAIAACDLLRKESAAANIEYWGFGARKPENWPEWINFIERPSDEELIDWYNRSIVFLVPSEYEGWGLPGSEAMCCGAALVSTRNGGVNAYAIDEDNALLVFPGDINAMAIAMKRLLKNSNQQSILAAKGESSIRKFNWTSSVVCMESALTMG